MIIQITFDENPLAPRPAFVCAYTKNDEATKILFLPQETAIAGWLQYSVIEEEAKSLLSFSPDGAWTLEDVRRIVVLAITEPGYPSSPASTYTVENRYGTDEYRDREDPPAGITLDGIPVKTGVMVLADYDIAEDNSRQVAGPVFKDLSEAMSHLGLPAACMASLQEW